MQWALWLNDENRAAKLHFKFKVLKQSACDALLTTGKTCERKTLRRFVKPGEIIVADCYYGLEYEFSGELSDMGASCVIRIHNRPLMKAIEELRRGGRSGQFPGHSGARVGGGVGVGGAQTHDFH